MLHWAPRNGERAGPATASGGAPARGLRIEVASLDSVESAWKAFEAQAVSTPFQAWAWIAEWARRSGEAGSARAVVALGHEGDALKLILPLAIERRYGASSLTWLGQDASDYNGPLIARDLLERLSVRDVEEILRKVVALAGGADCLRLEKQPEFLDGIPNPFAAFSATDFTCRAHATLLTGDWESFHSQKRSRKSVRRLKEKAASLAKHGDISFEEIRDPLERRAVVGQLLEWKSAQLEARGARNPFRDGGLGAFLTECATSPASADLIRIHVLKVGGDLAAGSVGLLRNGHYIYYVAAYDALRFARYSPGSILLSRLIEELHREGLSLFDFSNGDERYKDEWCDHSMGLTVTLLPLTLAGRAGIAAEAATLKAIREIKSRPRLFGAIRSVLSRLRSLKARGAA